MAEFEKLLTTNQPEAQALARELRRLIQRLLPEAQEKIYKGWGVADYGFSASSRGFLSIGPNKSYVNLFFMDGVELDDPSGLLIGTGKRLRHVKIVSPKDLHNKALHKLVREAARLRQG